MALSCVGYKEIVKEEQMTKSNRNFELGLQNWAYQGSGIRRV